MEASISKAYVNIDGKRRGLITFGWKSAPRFFTVAKQLRLHLARTVAGVNLPNTANLQYRVTDKQVEVRERGGRKWSLPHTEWRDFLKGFTRAGVREVNFFWEVTGLSDLTRINNKRKTAFPDFFEKLDRFYRSSRQEFPYYTMGKVTNFGVRFTDGKEDRFFWSPLLVREAKGKNVYLTSVKVDGKVMVAALEPKNRVILCRDIFSGMGKGFYSEIRDEKTRKNMRLYRYFCERGHFYFDGKLVALPAGKKDKDYKQGSLYTDENGAPLFVKTGHDGKLGLVPYYDPRNNNSVVAYATDHPFSRKGDFYMVNGEREVTFRRDAAGKCLVDAGLNPPFCVPQDQVADLPAGKANRVKARYVNGVVVGVYSKNGELIEAPIKVEYLKEGKLILRVARNRVITKKDCRGIVYIKGISTSIHKRAVVSVAIAYADQSDEIMQLPPGTELSDRPLSMIVKDGEKIYYDFSGDFNKNDPQLAQAIFSLLAAGNEKKKLPKLIEDEIARITEKISQAKKSLTETVLLREAEQELLALFRKRPVSLLPLTYVMDVRNEIWRREIWLRIRENIKKDLNSILGMEQADARRDALASLLVDQTIMDRSKLLKKAHALCLLVEMSATDQRAADLLKRLPSIMGLRHTTKIVRSRTLPKLMAIIRDSTGGEAIAEKIEAVYHLSRRATPVARPTPQQVKAPPRPAVVSALPVVEPNRELPKFIERLLKINGDGPVVSFTASVIDAAGQLERGKKAGLYDEGQFTRSFAAVQDILKRRWVEVEAFCTSGDPDYPGMVERLEPLGTIKDRPLPSS